MLLFDLQHVNVRAAVLKHTSLNFHVRPVYLTMTYCAIEIASKESAASALPASSAVAVVTSSSWLRAESKRLTC